jgi:hypothetical protein
MGSFSTSRARTSGATTSFRRSVSGEIASRDSRISERFTARGFCFAEALRTELESGRVKSRFGRDAVVCEG